MSCAEPADISVVIPAYNVEGVLARAVQSVLAQTLPPREIIVVDDGSQDGTARVARGFGSRIKYVRQDNAGVAAARNRAIREATGEWIGFLDADDWWRPNCLEWALDIARRHPGLRWVSGRHVNLWLNGTQTIDPESPAYLKLLSDDDEVFPDYYQAACANVQFTTSAMLIRKRAIIEAGLFDVALRTAEDLDLWWRIADRAASIGYVNRVIAVYDRRTETSLTRSPGSFSDDWWALLTKRVEPGTRPQGGPAYARECYLGVVMRRALRHAVRLGETAHIRRLLSAYGDWLPPAHRVVGWVACRIPAAVPARLGRLWRRCRGLD